MRTYFWISLFTSYRITAKYLIGSDVILIANKDFKKSLQVVRGDGKGTELVSGKTVPADLREG
jgi:hypothetical protein